jgi:hypothetical protein
MRDALAPKENVFIDDVAAGVGFIEDLRACAIPVDLSLVVQSSRRFG